MIEKTAKKPTRHDRVWEVIGTDLTMSHRVRAAEYEVRIQDLLHGACKMRDNWRVAQAEVERLQGMLRTLCDGLEPMGKAVRRGGHTRPSAPVTVVLQARVWQLAEAARRELAGERTPCDECGGQGYMIDARHGLDDAISVDCESCDGTGDRKEQSDGEQT